MLILKYRLFIYFAYIFLVFETAVEKNMLFIVNSVFFPVYNVCKQLYCKEKQLILYLICYSLINLSMKQIENDKKNRFLFVYYIYVFDKLWSIFCVCVFVDKLLHRSAKKSANKAEQGHEPFFFCSLVQFWNFYHSLPSNIFQSCSNCEFISSFQNVWNRKRKESTFVLTWLP